MSNAILELVQQQLGSDSIQQMSRSIGADPGSTSKAISMALPAILGGLSQNAAQPQGAAALDNALNQHDGGILDNLSGFLGGGAGGGIGGEILGHILGSKQAPVEQGVGKAAGLNAAQVAQLMAMLAPIVMGVLGRMKQQKGIDANALPNVLGDPSSFGADDLLRMGGSVLGGMFGDRK